MKTEAAAERIKKKRFNAEGSGNFKSLQLHTIGRRQTSPLYNVRDTKHDLIPGSLCLCFLAFKQTILVVGLVFTFQASQASVGISQSLHRSYAVANIQRFIDGDYCRVHCDQKKASFKSTAQLGSSCQATKPSCSNASLHFRCRTNRKVYSICIPRTLA